MVDETLLLACNDGVIIVQYNVIIQSLFIQYLFIVVALIAGSVSPKGW